MAEHKVTFRAAIDLPLNGKSAYDVATVANHSRPEGVPSDARMTDLRELAFAKEVAVQWEWQRDYGGKT